MIAPTSLPLTLPERYRLARLYAAQVRARKGMGSRYAHATPWRGPAGAKATYRR